LVIDPPRRADCRLKDWYCNILRRQSATGNRKSPIDNRKSPIPAILGQATIAEILRKKRRGLELVLQRGIAAAKTRLSVSSVPPKL